METVWSFETARFTVELRIMPDMYYRYDGDDPDGETQAALDCGDLVVFDSEVRVLLHTDAVHGREIGSDHLGGSVYKAGEESEFWTAHRDSDPMGRNSSIMRAWHKAKTGHECSICHYFPEMVRLAIAEARATLCDMPRMRCAA